MSLGLTNTQLYREQMINKDLLSSTWTSIQYCLITYMGKESEKEWGFA